MPGLRLNRLEIQGFRAFGQKAQALVFPSALTAVWGPNSQGKTSLAEAVEFLLTGHTVRRELLASAQDEFTDALRNAHMPAKIPAFVQAEITGADGAPHTVKRRLVADYGKKQDCQTALEIDGKPVTEQALHALGFILSQPPLRAPVLAQHTLGYLFSARPQDRANYFKALLEVTDLEAFRAAVAGLESELRAPADPALAKLDAAISIAEAVPALAPLRATVPSAARIGQACAAATAALITAAGETVPSGATDRVTKVEQILADKRAKAFPIKRFDKQPLGAWTPPGQDRFAALAAYVDEREKVDEETRRLTKLFSEALALPGVGGATAPIDCPLCATQGSLTPHRIAYIRDRVKDTESFREAERGARAALGEITGTLQSVQKAIDDALPRFMVFPSKARRSRGFRVQRIRDLLGQASEPAIAAWLQAQRRLARARSAALRIIKAAVADVGGYTASLDSFTDATALQHSLTAFAGAFQGVSDRLAPYLTAEKAVAEPLNTVVAAASKTTGWQELIDLARGQTGLRAALVEAAIREQAGRELDQALRQIDRGNEAVLDGKFRDLSASIGAWWNLLRPNEPSFFAAVKPRPGARRTIDFKAGLSTKRDGSNPKLRDVIAVFSQSQLHCLGLALFIARWMQEGASFMVLDDPILSSDEDYRAFFTTSVLEKLIASGVQVILLTQDQGSWKDMGNLYLHENVAMFQLSLADPSDGTLVWNTADDLRAKLLRIDTLLRGGHPSLRKQGGGDLRDASERFCKEMLVKDRRAKGEKTVVISEYDGKNLGWLTPRVEPLLTIDPSHPGKLRAIASALNPADHDDDIPSQGALAVALGNLTQFTKEYLAS